jgi:hypothetical protein
MSQNRVLLSSLFGLAVLLQSCKTNQTINHQREGKWVYKDTVNGILYKSKGRYKKSVEIKTWRYYENRKLVKIEKYQDSLCNIKTFDQKGRITATGQSMMVEEADGTHWYIIGEWTFYNAKSQAIGIKKYQKGELISETTIQSNPQR